LLLNLVLPRINVHMSTAIVDAIHAELGAALPVGGKLLDLTVDLGGVAPHDCPPVSHYRLTIRERAWLRRLDVESGDEPAIGTSIALFSTAPDEPLEGKPERQIRVAIAGIIPLSDFGEAWP